MPLKILDWIGGSLIVIAVVLGIYFSLSKEQYNYIREGKPFVVRVLYPYFFTQYINHVPQNRLSILGDFMNPDTGGISQKVFSQNALISESKKKNLEITLKPGDLVTGVYIPGKFEKTVAIYGLLDLNPDISFLSKNGKPYQSTISVLKTLVGISLALVLLGLLVLCIYSVEFYEPLDLDFSKFLIPVLVACPFDFDVFLFSVSFRKKSRQGSIVPVYLYFWGSSFRLCGSDTLDAFSQWLSG